MTGKPRSPEEMDISTNSCEDENLATNKLFVLIIVMFLVSVVLLNILQFDNASKLVSQLEAKDAIKIICMISLQI